MNFDCWRRMAWPLVHLPAAPSRTMLPTGARGIDLDDDPVDLARRGGKMSKILAHLHLRTWCFARGKGDNSFSPVSRGSWP